MKDLLKMMAALLCFGAAAGLLLAYTNKVTAEPIARAQQTEKLAALSAVLPEFDNTPSSETNTVSHGGRNWCFYVARKDGKYAGAAFETSSDKGYAGEIVLMVGVQSDGTLNQVQVLSQNETPGLGSKIKESPFKDQFAGKGLAQTRWFVKKDGGDMDAITGATISSRAVAEALRKGIEAYSANTAAIAGTE